MTTLSGSHVIAGAAVAVSSLGSALAKAIMMGGGGGAPPPLWPRGLVQTVDPCTGSGIVLFGWRPLSTLNAQPPELKLCFKAWTQGASVL